MDIFVLNEQNMFFNVNSFSSEWLAYFETGARLLWAIEWSVHLQLRLTAGTGKGSQVETRKQSCCFSRRADTDNGFISLYKRRWNWTIATSHLVPSLPLAGTSQRRRQHWRPACSNEHVQTKKRERELQKREWEWFASIQELDKTQACGKETKGKSESWQKVTRSISVSAGRATWAVTQLFITSEECEVSLFLRRRVATRHIRLCF